MAEETEDYSIDELVDKYFEDTKSEREAVKEPTDGDPDEEDVEEGSEEESEESEDGDADEEEGDEPPASTKADDESEVTVQVDGKDLTVKVKDLKRLYGQEASLTQKSQAVAAASRALETQSLYLAKIIDTRLKSAEAKVAKYKDVDLFKASRELEPEEFDALRAAKADAESEFKLLTEEAQEFMVRATQARTELVKEQAKVSLVEIKKAIPEWNDKLYSDIRLYAIGQGLDRDTVNEVIDPGAIIMMHKAMLFDAAKAKSDNVIKKVHKAPKGVVKKSDNTNDYKASKANQIFKKAQATGDIDDIVDAVLAARNN
jgi:cellobiose-specific phosphotransferase system component IIA